MLLHICIHVRTFLRSCSLFCVLPCSFPSRSSQFFASFTLVLHYSIVCRPLVCVAFYFLCLLLLPRHEFVIFSVSRLMVWFAGSAVAFSVCFGCYSVGSYLQQLAFSLTGDQTFIPLFSGRYIPGLPLTGFCRGSFPFQGGMSFPP